MRVRQYCKVSRFVRGKRLTCSFVFRRHLTWAQVLGFVGIIAHLCDEYFKNSGDSSSLST
jgi:hypothetical protein